MRRALAPAVLALWLFSFSALPQQAPTTGSIEGIVVRGDTEQPIANAQVSLMAGESASVSTAADGKFVFKDLKPGAYRVAATANGFVRQEYGQPALNGSGRLLFVVAGQSINDATIRITPAGTVSGRILDQNGQPAVGAPVQLLRVLYNAQGRTYLRGGAAPADDRGNYRIFDVTPGRYYLRAGTPPAGIDLGPRPAPARPERYSVTYYPNVSNVDQAATIDVKAGNESSADMRVERQTRTFRVRGRVINPTGAPLQDMTVRLGYRTIGAGGGAVNIPDSLDPATGAFTIPNVPPGEFTVSVGQAIQPERAMGPEASLSIHVTNVDLDGLVLTLTPAVTVQGKLIVEGQPISAVPSLDRLRLIILNVAIVGGMTRPVSSTIDADGSFQVAGLREGEYRAQMSEIVPGFYVKSIKYAGEDVLGRTFKIGAGASKEVEVVLKAGTQTIAGTVTDAQSKPVPGIAVVVIPAQRGNPDLFRNTHTDQAGKFAITDLPPGEYKVFSWEAIDTNAYMDPDFMKPYEHLGKAISVTASSNSSVDVKLIPAQ